MLILYSVTYYNRRNLYTYETIASAFAGLSVCDDNCFFNIPEFIKKLPKRGICRMVGQTPHEDFRVCRVLLLNRSGHHDARMLMTNSQTTKLTIKSHTWRN